MSRTRFFLPTVALAVFILIPWIVPGASAAALPGGTLDPLGIPQYVTPLVIPPVMKNNGAPDSYAIAVRQFKQQILPGGIWNTLNGGRIRSRPRPCGATARRRTPRPRWRRTPAPSSTIRPTRSRPRRTRRSRSGGSTTWWTQKPGGSCPTCCRSTRPCTGRTRPGSASTERSARTAGASSRSPTWAPCRSSPTSRRPRRAAQRRLPGGVVPARRGQHPRGLCHEGQALR